MQAVENIRHAVPSYMLGHIHAITVNIIGAGGTASVLLQNLARIHLSMKALGKLGLMVTCIDDDIVTEANIGRQLFHKQDIGMYKSIVLIERINRFYGTCWSAIPERFSIDINHMEMFPGNVIMSCVDNVATRKYIDHYLKLSSVYKIKDHLSNYYWIDAGNGKDKGQVVIGSHRFGLPTIIDMYPDIDNFEDKDDTPSCSLAEALKKQDLHINPFIALTASNMLWNIVNGRLDYRAAYINLKKDIPIRYIRSDKL